MQQKTNAVEQNNHFAIKLKQRKGYPPDELSARRSLARVRTLNTSRYLQASDLTSDRNLPANTPTQQKKQSLGIQLCNFFRKNKIEKENTKNDSQKAIFNLFQNRVVSQRIKTSPSVQVQNEPKRRVKTWAGHLSLRKKSDLQHLYSADRKSSLYKYITSPRNLDELLVTQSCFQRNQKRSQTKKQKQIILSYAY